MSLGEILVILLIAMLITKPEDIPIIIKKIQELKSYCTNFKNQALHYITNDLEINADILASNPEQLNFYLEKIINLQGYYDGNYSLQELKMTYDELIKQKITDSIKN